MRCPTLKELPPPPPGKTGWPWTEESPQLPDPMPDGSPWPKVSIVTPSYNQGQFLEEAIRSVLLQGYPNLEYVIIDGGSDDNSVEIIKKYEPWLAYWISEPDDGVYYAINKGIRVAKGEIIGHLNSDDFYESNVFGAVVEKFIENPQTDIVSGGATVFEGMKDGNRKTIVQYLGQPHTDLSLSNITMGSPIINARFFHRRVYDKVGLYNTRYRFAADREFLIRVALAGINYAAISKIVYHYRQHSGSLTINPHNLNAMRFLKEHLEIAERYLKREKIAPSEKKIFIKLHSKEAARCVLHALKNMKILQSIKYGLQGWRFDKSWPVIFTTYSISTSLNLLFKLLSQEDETY